MVFCNKCNYKNTNSAKFCQGCGGELAATEDDGTLMAGVILDNRYEIKRLLKTGGFGSVYEAIDKSNNSICAVKEMLSSPSDTTEEREYLGIRFKREKEIFNELSHPNLAISKDSFIEHNRYYFVMDYIEGKELYMVMKEDYHGDGIPEAIVIEWVKQILDALDYLHNQSPPVIYRDLKPENIMLRTDGKIIIIDLGLARVITPDITMTAIGTPQYAPEELFAGKPEPRTDIYSLGATMHCLLTGIVPINLFYFKPLREVNQNISEEMEHLVARAVERNPEDRYENVRAMREDLEKCSKKLSEKPLLPLKSEEKTVRKDGIKQKINRFTEDKTMRKKITVEALRRKYEGEGRVFLNSDRNCGHSEIFMWFADEILAEKKQIVATIELSSIDDYEYFEIYKDPSGYKSEQLSRSFKSLEEIETYIIEVGLAGEEGIINIIYY
jgi:serine/threonine protein kinase